MLSIASWLLFVFFQYCQWMWTLVLNTPVSVMQWWEELLFLFHKSRRALKLHRSLVLHYWFCASLLVLLLRVWTINSSQLFSLPKFPIPQIMLPFLEQPCWNCPGTAVVGVDVSLWKPCRLLGGTNLADQHLQVIKQCGPGGELHSRLLINTMICDTLSCSLLESSWQNSDHSSWQPLWSNQLLFLTPP